MYELPPIQPWDAAHPLVVHLPLGILFAAPLLILLALAIPKWTRPFAFAALAMIGIGAVGLILAVSSGEAGAQLVIRTPEIDEALETHARLAYAARAWFVWLFAGFAVLSIYASIPAYGVGRKPDATDASKTPRKFSPGMRYSPGVRRWIFTLATFVYLAAYAAGLAALARAGHAGAALVHTHGIQALLTG